MTRSALEGRSVAYHEAGHAVASWRAGEGIGSVSIEAGIDPDTGDPFHGTFAFGPGRKPSELPGRAFRRLVVAMAGPAAQRIHDVRQNIMVTASLDLGFARRLAASLAQSHESTLTLLAWAEAEARARVVADWHLVEALAAELLDMTTLSGAAATRLLETMDRTYAADVEAMRAALADVTAL